jgi:hypothetical protein
LGPHNHGHILKDEIRFLASNGGDLGVNDLDSFRKYFIPSKSMTDPGDLFEVTAQLFKKMSNPSFNSM